MFTITCSDGSVIKMDSGGVLLMLQDVDVVMHTKAMISTGAGGRTQINPFITSRGSGRSGSVSWKIEPGRATIEADGRVYVIDHDEPQSEVLPVGFK